MKKVLLLGTALSFFGGVAFAGTAAVPAPAGNSSPTVLAQGGPDDDSDDGDYSAAPGSDWAEGSRDDWRGGPPQHWRGGDDNDGPSGWRGARSWHWGDRDGRRGGWRGGPQARMMPGKGAHIVLQHHGNRIDVRCAESDSTADCVAAVERLMDKITATTKGDRPDAPPPPPAEAPPPPASNDVPAGPSE
jgi:hypothetical protein